MNTSNIGNFIERRILRGELDTLSNQNLRSKRSLQGVSLIPIAVGRIGMVMICLHGAKSILNTEDGTPLSDALGVYSAVGATTTFGVFSVFNTFSLIDEFIGLKTEEEREIFAQNIPGWKLTAISSSSVVVGLLAHVALAKAAYDSAEFAPLLIYLGQQLDFGRAANSVYLSLKAWVNRDIPYSSNFELQLKGVQNNLISKIAECRSQLAHDQGEIESTFRSLMGIPSTEREELLRNQSFVSETGANPLTRYVKMILDGAKEKRAGVKPLGSMGRLGCKVITVLSALGIYAEFFALGKEGGKAVDDEPGFYYTAGTLVLLANSYIWGTLINKCSLVCADFIRGAQPKSIEADLRPKTHKAITFMGFLLAVPVFVPQMFFAKAYLPSELYWPVGISSSVGALLGGFATALGLRDRVIRSKEGQHPRIRLDEQLNRLSKLVQRVGPREMAQFIQNLPQDVREELGAPSIEKLNSYLGGQE